MMRLKSSNPIICFLLATAAAVLPATVLIWYGGRGGGEPPLAFSQYTVDKGVVWVGPSPEPLEFAFPFAVWQRTPVRITQVETTCACTVATGDLVGRELPPGASETLRIKLSAGQRAGVVEERALVHSDPASDAPMILSLKATILHPARMLGATPVLSGVAGAGRPRGVVRITRLRSAAEAPLQLEAIDCDQGNLRVIGLESTHSANAYTNTMADNVDITLEADGAYPIGVSKTTMRLAWKHGVPPTVAPLKIELRHPIRPALERIFLGELRPGEQRTVEVPLEVEGPLAVHSVRLGCEGSIVEAHLSGVPWRLVVLARAPTVPGRFEGQVHLQLAKPRLPATRLLVVGLVPPPARSDPIDATRNPNITHP